MWNHNFIFLISHDGSLSAQTLQSLHKSCNVSSARSARVRRSPIFHCTYARGSGGRRPARHTRPEPSCRRPSCRSRLYVKSAQITSITYWKTLINCVKTVIVLVISAAEWLRLVIWIVCVCVCCDNRHSEQLGRGKSAFLCVRQLS